jgi:hypothetical protein
MFDAKQKSLFGGNPTTSVASTSAFVKAGLKQAAKTTSLGNGAVKFTTTGNDFVDQFGKITQYRQPRDYKTISTDMSLLWSQNKLTTICLLFYIRMITRVVSLFDGNKTSTTQRGQGLKHEGIFRMIWLAVNAKESFWKNIALFISVGSWKDVITMLSYDLQWNGWKGRVLDWNQFGQLILAGLENPNQSNLLKKYLPQIKANKNCKTIESQADNMIAKWVCSLLFGGKTQEDNYKNYRAYRKLKTSGTAHDWQKLISQHSMLKIDFGTIHGRALAQLVSSKFLKNNGLETSYQTWISSQPVARYTGYVYELLAPVKIGYKNTNLLQYQKDTINKQFYGLIETAKKGMKDTDAGLLVVVDTSSSMTGALPGLKVTAYSVAKAMALYFSYLLKGRFQGAWMEFNDQAKLKTWKGSTPVEQLQNDKSEAYGSTNFQAVGRVFVKLKKEGVPESEFPSGILCVSDGCFNSTSSNKTNTRQLLSTLVDAGFSKDYVDNFKIILWDIPNGYYHGKSQTAFEDFADTPNLFHMSGLDPAAIAFITGVEHQKTTPKTSEELFQAAMDQEVLNLIQI